MFVMVLVIATPVLALKYPDAAPDFTGCANSAWVVWEFVNDNCYPTSDVFDPSYGYFPEPATSPTFGSRCWDQPTEDSGWGSCSYDPGLWVWDDGVFTVTSEDAFTQSIPERGGKKYLRQYFQVVHNIDPDTTSDPSIIGMGLEIWDMFGSEWPGCPDGYEDVAGAEYLGGSQFSVPAQIIEHGDGMFTCVWISDFSPDDSINTPYVVLDPDSGDRMVFPELYDATHTACIIGMSDEGTGEFEIEEAILDFIWFNEADGSDIPVVACEPRIPKAILEISPRKPKIYEPQDAGGPPPPGDPCEVLQIKLKYRPGDPTYPDFNCTVVIDPDPNQENAGNSDFSITNPVPPDPNGNVTLTFTQANWNVYQNVGITATADLEKEGDEGKNIEFTVTIDITDPNFGGPGSEPVKQLQGLLIADNDIPYISVLPYGQFWNVLSEQSPGVERCVNITLSHLPTKNVEVRGELVSDFDILLESMVVMDPTFEDWTDPNHLLFTPGNYNVAQTICLEAIDDDELAEAWLEWVPGRILLNGLSGDPRYKSKAEGGELKETEVFFNVQDNECGSTGYPPYDMNEDCYVDLSELAVLYGQWLLCTDPYDDNELCGKVWNLVE